MTEITDQTAALNRDLGVVVSDISAFGTDGRGEIYLCCVKSFRLLRIEPVATTTPPPPTITSIDPSTATTLGGTTINVHGTNFTPLTTVMVGTTPLGSPVVTSTLITGKVFALPSGESPGPRDVVVSNANGTDTLVAAVAYVAPPPTITAVDPITVSTLGGTMINIHGTNFTSSTTAMVGTTALGNLAVPSSSLITGTVSALPAGESPGPRDIAVSNPNGAATRAAGISYVAPPPPPKQFHRSDANSDGTIDIADPLFTFLYLFSSTSVASPICLEALDTNDDANVDLTDGIFTLNALFIGGPAPPPPHPACGVDPTPDGLTCVGTTCGP